MINKIIAEEKIQQVRKLLEKKEKIVITCHVSPDGDAIGASLGLYHFLDGLGKEVNVVVPDLLPRNLLFLKGTKEIVVYTRYPEFAEKLMSEAELIFCLDFNAISRIDRLQKSIRSEEGPYRPSFESGGFLRCYHLSPGGCINQRIDFQVDLSHGYVRSHGAVFRRSHLHGNDDRYGEFYL